MINTKVKFGFNDMLNRKKKFTQEQMSLLYAWLNRHGIDYGCVVGIYLLDEHGHSLEIHKHLCPGRWWAKKDYQKKRKSAFSVMNRGGYVQFSYHLHTTDHFPLELVQKIEDKEFGHEC